MTDVFDITDGVGGIWEAHQWNSGVMMNLLDQVDMSDVPVRDFIIVTKIGGLHSLPEHADPRSGNVARIGETSYPTNQLGKTVTYEGEIRATSVPSLRAQRTTLLAAFSDTTTEGYMDVLPQTPDSSPTARFYAKPLSLDIDEQITTMWGFRRSFALALRQSDPRFYFPSLAVDSSGNPVTVTNPGSAPADPVITVAGASGSVSVGNGTRSLHFIGVPAGSLVIDFKARTAKVGAARCELVVATSDWWDPFVAGIAGGATVTIAQTGGSGVDVAFTPASWA